MTDSKSQDTIRKYSLYFYNLKERAKEVVIIIIVEKTKTMVLSRRPGKGRTWTVGDHKIGTVS
jgi:hypothetical protein